MEMPPLPLMVLDELGDARRSVGTVRDHGEATLEDAALRRYWFRWTATGERAWREGKVMLDAYWEAHPPGG